MPESVQHSYISDSAKNAVDGWIKHGRPEGNAKAYRMLCESILKDTDGLDDETIDRCKRALAMPFEELVEKFKKAQEEANAE